MRSTKRRLPDCSGLLAFLSMILIVFGGLRLSTATPESFMGTGSSLASAYLAFVGAHQATYLYVPLFTFLAMRVATSRMSSLRLTRYGGRINVLKRYAYDSMVCSLCFAFAIVIPSIAAMMCKSGLLTTTKELSLFALFQVAYTTCFFLVVALVYIAAFLATRSAVLSMLLTVVYGGSDTFISALGTYQGEFWTGWMLMSYADPSNPVLALGGLLRILAIGAVLVMTSLWLMRTVDFMESTNDE